MKKKQSLGDFIFDYEKRFDADLVMIMTKKEELSLSNNISDTQLGTLLITAMCL